MQPVTQDNLQKIIDAKWLDSADSVRQRDGPVDGCTHLCRSSAEPSGGPELSSLAKRS